jgi:hypothetical protein
MSTISRRVASSSASATVKLWPPEVVVDIESPVARSAPL